MYALIEDEIIATIGQEEEEHVLKIVLEHLWDDYRAYIFFDDILNKSLASVNTISITT